MGFFKKLGKSLGGAVKGVTKMVSIKNAIGLATGQKSIGSLGKEALGRVVEGGATPFLPSAPSEDVATVEVGGREVQMTTANAVDAVSSGTAKGVTIKQILQGAAAGAASGVGATLATTKEAQTGGSMIAKAFTKEWLKQHWYIAAGVVVGLGLAIWAMFFRGKHKRKRW